MAKYEPLGDHLVHSASPVEMSFDEIDRLVGGLPQSAFRWRAWWGNDSRHVQAAAWLGRGRLIDSVDMSARRVTFQ